MDTLIKDGEWKMENGERGKRIAVFAFVLSIFYFPFSIFLSSAESATYYLDYANGSDSNDGSSWALAKKTVNGFTSTILAPADTVRIAKSPDPTSLGITATWTNLSRTVTLASGLTANVDLAEAVWTASTNVTASTSATRKEGSLASSLAIASGFTTGKAGYKTISSTDYSGYQQLSFWIRTNAQVNSGVLRIDLCSDTLGATPVDSFTINTTLYANQFYPLTIDKGSALGSAIQSVALYCISDPGTVTVLLDDIITAKASSSADALSLTSLIGKNTAGETWYGLKSINGTTLTIDNDVNSLSGAGRGYYGTTQTVTTYKRETIKTTPVSTSTTAVFTVQDSGTSGNLITFSGGWDTGTTTQDGETWFDGQNGFGYGFYSSAKNYVAYDKIGLVRYYAGFYPVTSATGGVWTSVSANNNTTYGCVQMASNITITANNNGSYGILGSGSSSTVSGKANNNLNSGFYGNSSGGVLTFSSFTASNNTNHGIHLYVNTGSTLTTITANSNSGYGINLQNAGNPETRTTFSSITANSNGTGGINLVGHGHTLTDITASSNTGGTGINCNDVSNCTFTNITTNSNTHGLYFDANGVHIKNTITSLTASGNSSTGFYIAGEATETSFYNSTFSSNIAQDVYLLGGRFVRVKFFNTLFSSTTELASGSSNVIPSSYLYSHRHDQVANRFKTWNTYTGGFSGIISDQITGGQTAGWARGGSGICAYLNPLRTTAGQELNWEFWIPVTASTSTTLSFYHKITTNFNGSLKITVYDSDDNFTKLINAASVTLTNNGAWNSYTSSAFTPTDTGFCRVVLQALDGATTGDIGIDDITLSPDPDVNFGAMDRWMKGLPGKYMTDTSATTNEHSFGWIE